MADRTGTTTRTHRAATRLGLGSRTTTTVAGGTISTTTSVKAGAGAGRRGASPSAVDRVPRPGLRVAGAGSAPPAAGLASAGVVLGSGSLELPSRPRGAAHRPRSPSAVAATPVHLAATSTSSTMPNRTTAGSARPLRPGRAQGLALEAAVEMELALGSSRRSSSSRCRGLRLPCSSSSLRQTWHRGQGQVLVRSQRFEKRARNG